MPFSLRTFQILTGVEASLSFLKFGQHSSESDWHKTTEEVDLITGVLELYLWGYRRTVLL